MGKFYGSSDGSFLLSLDGSSLGAAGAKGKQKERKKERRKEEPEIEAESKPRTQQQWREIERKRSRLPRLGEQPEAASPKATKATKASKASKAKLGEAEAEGDGAAPGRKKQRRLQLLAARKANEGQREAVAAKEAAEAAHAALHKRVRTQDLQVREAAAKFLAACPKGAASEQRLLALAAERIAAEPKGQLELFDVFFELHRRGSDSRTQQLALLSAIAIFRDLVPGYRIREPNAEERSQLRSKETLAVSKHEMELLQTYRQLLPLLETALRQEPMAYASALAALVKTAFDFNLRQRLLGTAVGYASHGDAAVRKLLASGLQEMFEADMRLEASREVVLAVGRRAQGAAKSAGRGEEGAQRAQRALSSELLKALLHIPIGRAETAELRGDAGDLEGADEEVRRGLQEASVSHNVQQLQKAETELLYEVFVVYLRILRQRHIHGRELLGAVLTGLARWGQHVNLELLLEILNELRRTVEEALSQSDGLVSLQGLNCALSLLSGPSQALIADATWLADSMTKALALALPALSTVHSESQLWPPARCFSCRGPLGGELEAEARELQRSLEAESVPALVLRCLASALRCPQGYGKTSDAALATLTEQLFLLAANADSHVALALLREAALLLKKHYKLHILLEAEGGLFGLGGVTDRAVSVAWHLQALACSLLPELARAGHVLPTAIPQRRTLIAEIFPMRDSESWMQAEFPRHIAALSRAPAPRPPRGQKPRRTTFLSEADVAALL